MKLKITVDTLDQKSLAQLATLASTLNGDAIIGVPGTAATMEVVSEEVQPTEAEIETAKKAEAAAKRKAAREKKKADEAAAKLAEDQAGNDKSVGNEDNSTSEDPGQDSTSGDAPEEVTKTMLQTLIRQKSVEKNEEHRPALKKELARLGAKNVSTLDEKHYAEFHQFMSDLK